MKEPFIPHIFQNREKLWHSSQATIEVPKTIDAFQVNMETWYKNLLDENGDLRDDALSGMIHPHFIGCDFTKGTSTFSHTAMEWQLNPQNMQHGGITSTAFDTDLGFLAQYYVQPYPEVAVSLNVTFLKPIFEGNTYFVESKIESLGKSLITVSGTAWTDDKRNPIATCMATYKAVTFERGGKNG